MQYKTDVHDCALPSCLIAPELLASLEILSGGRGDVL
jgi:hypothetical protein